MRRQGSTSNATLHGDGALPRSRQERGQPAPARPRGGRLYLTTALVGAGLCLMQVPAAADTVRLLDALAVDGANIDLRDSMSATYRFWRTPGSPSARNFRNGDTLLLHSYGTTGITLTASGGNVRPLEIRVQSSEYTIVSGSPGVLRGTNNSAVLKFGFEGADHTLRVEAQMAGLIEIGRTSGEPGTGGRLVYAGDTTTARVRVIAGTTLEVAGSMAATDTDTNGFRLGDGSSLIVADGGTATGNVNWTNAGGGGTASLDTAVRVDGILDGDIANIEAVVVGATGTVTGSILTNGAMPNGADPAVVGSLHLEGATDPADPGATVGRVGGTGLITFDGDVTATGVAGKGAEIGAGGQFHAVNGGGTFTTAGTFESAGSLGSANAADGVTGITADLIRLTGGALLGEVALDGALEVGNLGLAGITLDGNDILRDTLDVLANGRVTVADDPAGFDANGAAITVAANGNFIAAGNVANVASLQSAGGFRVDAGKTMGAGSVLLTGGNAYVYGTLASAAPLALEGGNLTVDGTVQGGIAASGGMLKLTGSVVGDVTLTTDAELAGSVGALLLDVPADPAAPPYEVVTTADLEATSVTQRAGLFTIAAGTTLTSGSVVRVEGGQLVVRGTTGALNVTQGGMLHLDGGATGTVINRGLALLHGTMDGLDNRGLGSVVVDGLLTILNPGGISNEGLLTIDNAGVVSMTGALASSGTLVLNGSADAVANTGILRVDATGDGSADSIDNDGSLTVLDGGRLSVAGGIDNAGGSATIAGELVGNVTGGAVTVAGTGKVTGDVASSGVIQSSGEVTGTLAASGTATVSGWVGTLQGLSGGTVTMTNASAGTDLLLGALQNDGAAMTVNTGAGVVVTGSAANAAGSLTIRGDLDVSGTTDGRLDNAGTLTVSASGSLTGDLRQSAGSTTIAQGGTVTGDATIAGGSLTLNGGLGGGLSASGAGTEVGIGANGSVAQDVTVTGATLTSQGTIQGGLTVAAGGSATIGTNGSVAGATSNQNGTLTVNGALEGGLTQTGAAADTTIAANGAVTGNVLVSGGMLTSRGTITGNLTNNAGAGLAGIVTGTLSGTGTATTVGDLALGGLALSGSGALTVDDGDRLTLGGTGTLQGNAQLHVDGGTLVGDVSLNAPGTGLTLGGGGELAGSVVSQGTVTVAGQATLTGALENHGIVTGSGLVDTLAIVGDLSNYGTISAGLGGVLIVNVSGYYENFGGSLGSGVTLIGNVRNSQAWLIDADFVVTSGDLLNAATGGITLDADLSMSGHNLTNAGTIAVNATGSISDVALLTNQNGLTIAAGGSITADQIVNDGGTVTNAGLLAGAVENRSGSFTSTGEIAGTFTNTGTASLTGSATAVVNGNGGILAVPAAGTLTAGSVRNGAGGRMTVAGTLDSADLRNEAGGTLTSTGVLLGSLRNEGTAVLSGSAATVLNAGGSLSLGGNLTVASLTNQAGLTVGSGRTLTLAGTMLNDGTGVMTVGGTVAGGIDNGGSLTITAGGSVASVVNLSGGTLALRGSVVGMVTNRAGGLVEVTAPTAQVAGMDNLGSLRVGAAGHLTVANDITSSGNLHVTGALTATTLHNSGTLTSRGTLTAQVVNTGTARVSGAITGGYTNLGGITRIVRDLGLTGPLSVEGGRVLVKAGATLTAGTDPVVVTGPGWLAVSGRVQGDVTNAGTLVTQAGARITGTVANAGTAKLAGQIDTLNNEAGGTAFVHGDLTVASLVSQGSLTVGAGRAMTVGSGVLGGTTTVAGSLSGAIENQGRLVARGTVSGLHNALGARTDLAGGTLADAVNDGEVRVTGAAGIGAGGLVSSGTLRLLGSARLTIDSQIHNMAAGEMIVAAGAHSTGAIVNDGLLTSSGVLSGALTNNGTARLGNAAGDVVNNGLLQSIGTLTVAGLTNNDRLRVGAGSVLRSDAVLVTAAGGTSTVNGTLDAAMLVESGGRLVSTGRLQRDLTVEGEASLAGRAATVVTEAGSSVRVTGDLQVDRLSNAGNTVVQAGAVLTPVTLENLAGGALTVAGRVQGNIDNAGQLIGANGSVSGDVILRATGTITGVLNIEGQLIIAQLQSAARGFSMLAAPESEAMVALDVAGGQVLFNVGALAEPLDDSSVIEEGSIVVLNDGALIQSTGDLTVLGTLIADTTNEGTLTVGAPGLVQGNILTSGNFSLAGTVNGSVTFAGGDMSFEPTGTISGDLVLAADHEFASGETVRAARLVVNEDVEMALGGAAPGVLTVDGDLVNDGTLALADGAVGDVVTVTGALSGSGLYRLDTDIAAGTADRVEVTGGPVSGVLSFDIRDAGNAEPDFGQAATLLSWDTAFNGANSYSLADPVGLPEATERVIYLVVADDDAGEIQLISAANPAVGAISGNIVLTQSLIGTVINRPSSPYTTGIGFEADRACRMGSWARAVGGTADATGATRGAELPNGERISVESKIDASYHGFQVGTDLGCYDGRFAEWTLIGGAILGMNSGSTTQPVYAVDPITGRATAEMTSVNDADFDQKYAGVYVSAMKGSWVVDLQLRREWTAFKLNNTPQPGSLGLRLTDAEFDSRATTVSGSVGYSMPLGAEDSGWSLTPTAGFAWTKTSTDTIVFDDDSTLALDDSETRIGFIGAGLSRTRLAEDGRSAMSLFASGTWYKDFAKPAESTFTLMQSDGTTSVQRLSSDNLGSFGEVSLGASYVRLMDGTGPIKQLNATIRVDGRTGSALDSYGVTGQLRLQF